MTRSGGRRRPRRRAVGAVGGGVDLVAAGAQVDAPARGSSWRSSSTTRIRVIDAGPAAVDESWSGRRPGCRRRSRVPPMASVKPRAMARPRPTRRCRCGRRGAGTGRTSARRSLGGTPGPVVDDAQLQPVVAGVGRRPRPAAGRAVPAARCRRRLATTRSSRPGSAQARGRSSGTSTSTRARPVPVQQRRGRRPRPGRPAASVDGQRAGLQAAQREQVVDQVGQPVGGLLDRGEQLGAVVRRSRSTSGWRRLDTRGLDPGQRRAQVVADGGEQRRRAAGRSRRARAAWAASRGQPLGLQARRAAAARPAEQRARSSANSARPSATSRSPVAAGVTRTAAGAPIGGADRRLRPCSPSPRRRSATVVMREGGRGPRSSTSVRDACSASGRR